ncbi:hypothetical protein HOO65_070078 [Ceratocystis lukuohia]|uniref:Uncharacterized protein n=1 Tax=Ceratocystis lukuohia TaxID=2019550 RepID=A0ABR4MBH6_9PEZI
MVSSKFSRRKALDSSAKQKSPIVSRAPAVKKFDSDDEDMADQIEEQTSRIEAVAASPTDDSEADSDDDAPKAISTSAAANIAKQSAKAAQKAIQEAAAAEKKKRQERDLKFKEQAAARKAREEKLEAEIAAAKALLAKPGTATGEEDDESRTARRKKTAALPDVLPLEFLDSDDSDNSDDDASHDKGADTKAEREEEKQYKPASPQVVSSQHKPGLAVVSSVNLVKFLKHSISRDLPVALSSYPPTASWVTLDVHVASDKPEA